MVWHGHDTAKKTSPTRTKIGNDHTGVSNTRLLPNKRWALGDYGEQGRLLEIRPTPPI